MKSHGYPDLPPLDTRDFVLRARGNNNPMRRRLRRFSESESEERFPAPIFSEITLSPPIPIPPASPQTPFFSSAARNNIQKHAKQ